MNIHVNKTKLSGSILGVLNEFFKLDITFNKDEGINKDDYILNIIFKVTKRKK